MCIFTASILISVKGELAGFFFRVIEVYVKAIFLEVYICPISAISLVLCLQIMSVLHLPFVCELCLSANFRF